MSEMAWYGKSMFLVMCLILAISESTFAFTESKWSNGNHAGVVISRGCTGGSYVQSMEWKEENGYGIIDLKMVCSTGSGIYFTNNQNGFWNSKMACAQKGFHEIVGMEENGYGIVNIKSRCYNDSSILQSNSNSNGKWNRGIICPIGMRITGMKVREQPYFGIINFQPACAKNATQLGYSTTWSNNNQRGEEISHMCPSGQVVVGMQWKEEDNYGIVDLRMKCALASNITGSFTFTHNANGVWNDDNMCLDSGAHSRVGYSALYGREEEGAGIINVKSICYSGNSEKNSNLNLSGHWNQQIYCPYGQIIVGMSIREQYGFGIINIKSYCGNVSI